MRISSKQFEIILTRYFEKKKLQIGALTRDEFRARYAIAFTAAIDFIEEHTNADLLNLSAIGSSDKATYAEQEAKFALLGQFLDESLLISANGNKVTFNPEIALGVKAKILDPELSVINNVNIYDDPKNLSIREKYSRGILTGQHWLTDMDLQRMLEIMGLRSTIKISPFTELSLGTTLHFARKDNGAKTEPYTVPLLLNCGSLGITEGAHWINATITVDPIANTISYVINDSRTLTAAQKEEFKKLIERAIQFDDGSHCAYPTAEIINGQIRGTAQQKDSYSCGYRALHQLLGIPSISGTNENARRFSELDASDSRNLVRSVYQTQLEDFAVPRQIFDILSSSSHRLFEKPHPLPSAAVKVKATVLTKFLKDLLLTPECLVPSTLHFAIDNCIGQYSSDRLLMSFPEGPKIKELDEVQYASLFGELAEKQRSSGISIPHFILTHADIHTLDGLSAFYAESSVTLFKKLTIKIDLDQSHDLGLFFSKLNFALKNLAKTDLEHLEITSEKGLVHEEQIQALIHFVKERQIGFNIDLPLEYQNSKYQYELDSVIAINRREINEKGLKEQKSHESMQVASTKKKAVRSREKINLHDALKIDIELQEGVEETVVVDRAPKKRKVDSEYPELRIHQLALVSNANSDMNFSVFAAIASGLSKADFMRYWHQLFGNIVVSDLEADPKEIIESVDDDFLLYGEEDGSHFIYDNKELSGITEEALARLIEYKDCLPNGINIRQLPQGFVVISDPKDPALKVLHYDKGLQLQAPIAQQLNSAGLRSILSIDLVEQIIATQSPDSLLVQLWNKINKADDYSRKNSILFRKNVADLMSLSEDQLAVAVALCGGVDNFNVQKLDFIFKNMAKARNSYADPYDERALISIEWLEEQFPSVEEREQYCSLAHQIKEKKAANHPIFSIFETDNKELSDALKAYDLSDVQLNQMLFIYDKYGTSGISKILNTWANIKLVATINWDQLPSIQADVEGYEAMIKTDEILLAAKTISGFSTEQRQWWNKLYAAHQPVHDNLAALVRSFTDFSAALAEYGLQFYDFGCKEPLFPGAGNLPTTLGRILSILNLCKRENRSAQWEVMSQLNLSAQGAIRAFTDGIVNNKPCAFVVPAMRINGQVGSNDGYDTVHGPVSLSAEQGKDFYRYLAYQKHCLPVAFYEEALASLELARANGTIPSSSVNLLYSILIHATTGDNYRFFISDVKSARVLWASIMENIQNIKLPIKTEFVKRVVVDSMFSLPRVPALPILAKLVALIATPLQGVGLTGLSALGNEAEKLEASNQKLTDFIERYGNKIYLGMKFYSDRDFKREYAEKRNLFEEHLAVSQQIEDAGCSYGLLSLVSTFSLDSQTVAGVSQAIKDLNTALNAQLSSTNTKPPAEFEDQPVPELTESELQAQSIRGSAKKLNQFLVEYALQTLDGVEHIDGLNADSLKEFIASLGPVIEAIREQFYLEVITLNTQSVEMYDRLALIKDKESAEYKALDTEYELLVHKAQPLSELNGIIAAGAEALYISNPLIYARFLTYFKKQINSAAEKQFKDRFPEGYFERLNAGEPKAEIGLQVDKLFPKPWLREEVRFILASFSGISDAEQLALLGVLSDLVEGLTEAEQQKLFMRLKDKDLLNTSINQYKELLSSINQYGNASFIYLMQSADQFGRPIEDLARKANYFLSQALPQIRRNKEKELNEIEAVELAADLVLAAKKDELGKEFATEGLLVVYQALIKAIASSDIGAIREVVAANRSLAELPAIKELEGHLIWCVTDEFELRETSRVEIQKRPVKGGTGLLDKLWGLFSKPAAPQFEEYEVVVTEKVKHKKEKHLDATILSTATTFLEEEVTKFKSYDYVFGQAMLLIEGMIIKYPAAKSMLLSFSRHYLRLCESDGTQVEQSLVNLRRIKEELENIGDQDVVISLCEHFGKEQDAKSAFSYQAFLAIIQGKKLSAEIDYQNYPSLSLPVRSGLFKIITSLLNNDKPCTLKDIQWLIDSCVNPEKGALFVEIVEKIFKCAPFPTLDRVQNWFDLASKSPEKDPQEFILEHYTTWNKTPVAREECNGFNLEFAKNQYEKMEGIKYSVRELEVISENVEAAREMSTSELLDKIKKINPTSPDTPTQLVALMAELLYRTKGLDQKVNNENREWGRSFEINTTQYLAIHAMLKSGGHVTSQIGTGEGKSRIMMIAIACQYALGKTVDFVTSDLSLATRDYLEYQSFFKALGAKTNLIYAQTPAGEYRREGINFSDAANLNLFRNKARSEGQEDLVIAAVPSQRCLMLDEADRTYFDASDTRFNYSAQADPAIRDMPWIYDLMVSFFSDPANEALYYADADRCNEQFFNFAQSKISDIDMARLIPNPKIPMPLITRNQLEAWQSSALTALSLELDKDFTIKPDLILQTKSGPQTVSQAQLVTGSRASGSSKFSFGVHQCLHARLNLLRKTGAQDERLSKELASLNNDFYIDPENQIVYSSTSKALIDDYAKGSLLAVTGTRGSIQEVEEAEQLYGNADRTKMAFIDVPRHKDLNRNDFPVAITSNENEQRQSILKSIRQSLDKNPPQPILLVCENDAESEALHTFLKANLSMDERELLTRISAKTKLSTEADHVKNKAGQSGSITVSTAMLGRGTDIKLHGAAKKQGLNVIATYLPRKRDYLQIIGRAGRFGDPGESRLILDKNRVLKQIGVDVLPIDFYTATEAYLDHVQKVLDTDKQKQRIVKNVVGDLRLQLTNQFFNDFYKPLLKLASNKEHLLEAWKLFFDKTDKIWGEVWPRIAEELSKSPCDKERINHFLVEYHSSLNDEWTAMKLLLKAKINAGLIKGDFGEDFVDETLKGNKAAFKLSDREGYFLSAGKRTFEKGELITKIADKYDPAFIGRAVIYTHFTDSVKAFFNNIVSTWRDGTPLFPNLRAVLNKNMSWSQFFLGASGSPLATPVNRDMSSSYGKILGKPETGATLGSVGEEAHESVTEVDAIQVMAAKTSGTVVDTSHQVQSPDDSEDANLEDSPQITQAVK